MPPKLIIEVLGDSSQLERTFARSSRSAKGFDRDIRNTGRGALAASLSFKGLGRSVGFASAAFLGGAGFTAILTSTVKAAEESQRVLGQTKVALESSGKSWAKYGEQVERATKATSQLSGFDDERLLGTFDNFVRRTKNVTEALKLNALSADVARGRNIDLEAAASLVTRASLGMSGALRRVGIAADKSATSTELLQLLTAKYAGSAAAYGNTAAGAQDKFRVALENTQEVLGAALLPTLTNVLDVSTKWLNNEKNQKKIADDAAVATQGLATAYTDLAGAIKTVQGLQGTRSSLKDSLGPFGFILGGPVDTFKEFKQANVNLLKALGLPSDNGDKALDDLSTNVLAKMRALAAALIHATFQGPGATGAGIPTKIKGSAFLGLPETDAQLRAIALARTAGTGTEAEVAAVNAQLAADQKAIGFASAKIAARKGNLKKFADDLIGLEGDKRSQLDRLAAISAETAAAAQAASDKIKAKEAKRRQAVQDAIKAITQGVTLGVDGGPLTLGQVNKAIAGRARAAEQAKVFRLIGLTAAGDPRAPNRGNLLTSLTAAQSAIAGGPLDSKAMQTRLRSLGTVIKTEFGKLTRENKIAVGQFLDSLNPSGSALPFTRTHALNLGLVTANLGLTNPQRSALRSRLAGQHLLAPIHVETTVVLDGEKVGRATTIHQRKAAQRTPVQTRGRQAP